MINPGTHPTRGPHSSPGHEYTLSLALFFMAFGYALLSVCLFRVLAFVINSTSFFMLYVCVGMPLGALLAKIQFHNPSTAIQRGIQALLILILGFPLLGWIIAHGPSPLLEDIGYQIRFRSIWKQLAYMSLFTSPLFILWGAAEYSGYKAALAAPKLRKYFYLIFVWALACALIAGAWTIPHWGWLQTLVLAALAGAVSWLILIAPKRRVKTCIATLALLIPLWLIAGHLEKQYTRSILPNGLHRVGSALQGRHPLSGQPLPANTKARLIHQSWGQYCHLEMVELQDENTRQVLGYYDGGFIWACRPDSRYPASLDDFAFRTLRSQSDVCVLGSGGGRQVALALKTQARSVTAVDIIPELFPLLQGQLAWTNGGVYTDSRVDCVAGDGRHYLEKAQQFYDLIILPHTESLTATRKSAIEPGRFVHTVEAFQSMKNRLKPQGVLAVIKLVDRDNRLFFTYANSLLEAGLNVRGWTTFGEKNPFGVHGFILLATRPDFSLDISPELTAMPPGHPHAAPKYYTNFPKVASLHDASPWTMGLTGLFFEPNVLKKCLVSIFIPAFAGMVLLLIVFLRSSSNKMSAARSLLLLLACAAIGLNAVCLENALIFWLIPRLSNPLSAFFIGAALFLALWGFSSFGLSNWKRMAALGAAGSTGLVIFSGHWQGWGLMAALSAAILGSGLLFPLIGTRFQRFLLVIFAADALGGLLGGLIGIWIPLLMGFEDYFSLLPAIPVVTILLAWVALKGQPGQE